MARKLRKQSIGKYFHVMVQGIGKEYIFASDECKGFYLKCLKKNKAKAKVKIIAFCIMGNHGHILLSVKDIEELTKYFRYVNAEYAMYYNRAHKRVGYVFRDRFKSEVISDEKYLANCLVYIQNNPVKAGIVKNAEDYQYSSYTNYLTGSGIVDFNEAKKHFDISLDNMRAIMAESSGIWMEHDDKQYEDKEEVLKDLIQRYRITSYKSVRNPELMVKLAQELKERAGVSLREIARMLEVNRESLRKAMSTPPSDCAKRDFWQIIMQICA